MNIESRYRRLFLSQDVSVGYAIGDFIGFTVPMFFLNIAIYYYIFVCIWAAIKWFLGLF